MGISDTSESESEPEFDDDDEDEEDPGDENEEEDEGEGSFDEEENDDFEEGVGAAARKPAATRRAPSPPANAPRSTRRSSYAPVAAVKAAFAVATAGGSALKRKAGQRTTRRSSGVGASDFEDDDAPAPVAAQQEEEDEEKKRNVRSSPAKSKRSRRGSAADSPGATPVHVATASSAGEGCAAPSRGQGGEQQPRLSAASAADPPPNPPPAVAQTPGYHPDLGFDPTLFGGDGEEEGEEAPEKKKKKGAVSKELKARMRGQDPRAKILHVMYKINRPGNVGAVEGFTGHKIPKGIVQGTLEELAKNGDLCVSDGHGKVYWFNQDLFKAKGTDLGKLNAELSRQAELLAAAQAERAALEGDLRRLEADPSEADLALLVTSLEATRDGLRARQASLRAAAGDLPTPAAREKQRRRLAEYREAWVRRRRSCMDALSNVADAADMKPKDAASAVGIETDDDAGVQVPALPGSGGGGGGRNGMPPRPVVKYLGKKR